MTCRPMFCEGRADCGDTLCPGHPKGPDAELTRRQQESEQRWPNDIGMGDETARPDLIRPPSIAVPYTVEGPHSQPFAWDKLVLYIGAVVFAGFLAAVITAEPQTLQSITARILAALS